MMSTDIKTIAQAALAKTAALSKLARTRFVTPPGAQQQQQRQAPPKQPLDVVMPMENDETLSSLLDAGKAAERISSNNDVTNETAYNEQKGRQKNVGTGIHQQRYREQQAKENAVRARAATAERYPFAYVPLEAKTIDEYAHSGHTAEDAARVYYERLVNEAYANDPSRRDKALRYNLNVDGAVGKSLWKSLWSRSQDPELDKLWVQAYGMAAKNRQQAHDAEREFNTMPASVPTFTNQNGMVVRSGQATPGRFDGSNMTYAEVQALAKARADIIAKALGLAPGDTSSAYMNDALLKYLADDNTYMRTQGEGKNLSDIMMQYGRNHGWGDAATRATLQRIQDNATKNIYNNNNNAYNLMKNNLIWNSRW